MSTAGHSAKSTRWSMWDWNPVRRRHPSVNRHSYIDVGDVAYEWALRRCRVTPRQVLLHLRRHVVVRRRPRLRRNRVAGVLVLRLLGGLSGLIPPRVRRSASDACIQRTPVVVAPSNPYVHRCHRAVIRTPGLPRALAAVTGSSRWAAGGSNGGHGWAGALLEPSFECRIYAQTLAFVMYIMLQKNQDSM